MKFIKKQKGFTLAELIAATIVFAVLATATTAQYNETRTAAQVAQVAPLLEQMSHKMTNMFAVNSGQSTTALVCPATTLSDSLGSISNTTAGVATLTYTYDATGEGGTLVNGLNGETVDFDLVSATGDTDTTQTDCITVADLLTAVAGDVVTLRYELDASSSAIFARHWHAEET